jgi:hypothetical protein
MNDVAPARFSKTYAIGLTAAIIIHALLLTWMLRRIVFATTGTEAHVGQLLLIVVSSVAVFAALLFPRRSYCWTLLIGACTFVAAASQIPASVTILTGTCLWIGLMAATSAFQIHFAPVYVVMLLLPFIVFHKHARETLVGLGRRLVAPAVATTGTESGWAVLLGTVVVVHLLIVAKPEVGYDAIGMHLQFPQLWAAHHLWTFDTSRYAWAVMPLGADLQYAAAYLLAGEGGARLLNLAFSVVVCHLTYRLLRLYARREIAIASVCLLASMPLAFLLTGSLFVENLWVAYLLAALLLAIDYTRKPSAVTLAAFMLTAAGAMQCKVTSVFWIGPLVLYMAFLLWRQRRVRVLNRATIAVLAIALLIGVWPYANAWIRTGNPVFPFMNALFRSPLFDVSASFNNPRYDAPLRLWSPYELIVSSHRFLEGADGAAGFHWLLLFPIVAFAFVRRRPRVQWLCLALVVIFFVSVFTQQAYLRYLLPALVLFAIVAGWALEELPNRPMMRAGVLTIGAILVLLNVRFLYTSSWTNSDLCPRCAFDATTRYRNIAAFAPQRVIGEYLNRALPDGRVGFFILNEASPAGYVGYSRGGSWHDHESFMALATAQSAEDILKFARRYRLTHAVVADAPTTGPTDVVGAFRDRYTTPVWRSDGRAVVAIQPEAVAAQPDAAATPADTSGTPTSGKWTTKLLPLRKPGAGSASASP